MFYDMADIVHVCAVHGIVDAEETESKLYSGVCPICGAGTLAEIE